MAKPDRQVCPICGDDDDVRLHQVDDEWIFTCEGSRHPLYDWRPKRAAGAASYRNGLGEELGVYDDLLACVGDGLTEYGVIEHRFSERSPQAYRALVDRYGHRAIKPKSYTASAFLGGALGQLAREQLLVGRFVPATGYWAYNEQVGGYGPAGTALSAEILSWEVFARDELHIDPGEWPALGYKPPA